MATRSGRKARIAVGQDAPSWAAETAYALNALVQPGTPNGKVYRCTTPGTSDATEPATWPTTAGATVTDGTVTWTCMNFLLGEMNEYNIDRSANEIDTSVFYDDWGKSDAGMIKASGSFSGFCDEDDEVQKYLKSCCENGDIVPYIRFYSKYAAAPSAANPVYYEKPDVDTDAEAGLRILAFNKRTANNSVMALSINYSASGPVTEVKATA